MAINQFDIKRTAFFAVTLKGSISDATTHTATGVAIPAGAIVTGVRVISPDAVTLTAASATVQLRAGTEALASTWNVSTFPAIGVPSTVTALLTAGGVLLAAGGELNLVEASSVNAAATGSYDFYVDYLYCSSHESA